VRQAPHAPDSRRKQSAGALGQGVKNEVGLPRVQGWWWLGTELFCRRRNAYNAKGLSSEADRRMREKKIGGLQREKTLAVNGVTLPAEYHKKPAPGAARRNRPATGRG